MTVTTYATGAASLIASTAALTLLPSYETKKATMESFGMPSKNHQQTTTAVTASSDENGEKHPEVIANSKSSSSLLIEQSQHDHQPLVMLPSSNDCSIDLNAWSQLSPVVGKKDYYGRRNVEISAEWKADDDLLAVAQSVIEKTNEWFIDDNENEIYPSLRLANIVSSMKAFVNTCQLRLDDIEGYKLKLGAMYGKSATRCPAWHTDYVTIRWIQTMLGPGTNYLDCDSNDSPYLQRVRSNNKEQEIEFGNDRPDWKDFLVDKSGVPIQQAPTGQPIVLVGNAWSQWAKQQEQGAQIDSKPRSGVLHRSPHGVSKKQGRVLFSMDVIHSGACQKECCAPPG